MIAIPHPGMALTMRSGSFSNPVQSNSSTSSGSTQSSKTTGVHTSAGGSLILKNFGFTSFGVPSDSSLDVQNLQNGSASVVAPGVIGVPLNYPNPFRLATGTELGYYLTKNLEITLRIYDMRGRMILENTFPAGSEGGKGAQLGYNRVSLTRSSFNNQDLSSGVYFYFIIYNSAILSRGKMAIIP